MAIKENIFANLMQDSIRLFDRARNRSIQKVNEKKLNEVRSCWKDVIDISKVAEMVKSYEDFHLETAEMAAVIITGLSCTGKTTIARILSKKYPEYELINFDRFGLELLRENRSKYVANISSLDDDMVIRMGERLENAARNKKNLIIEGEYCSINARGALLKTLREYGYKKICLISTLNIPYETQTVCASKRAMLYAYTSFLSTNDDWDFKMRSFDEDVYPIIEKALDVKKVMKTDFYRKNVHDIEVCRKNEFVNDMVPVQLDYELFYAGVDVATEWF